MDERVPPSVGGRGGTGLRLGRRLSCRQSHGNLADDPPRGDRRTPRAPTRTAARADSQAGSRTASPRQCDPRLLEDLQRLLEPVTRGDPEGPCFGHPRAPVTWRRPWWHAATRSAMIRSAACSTRSATACKPTARPRRGRPSRPECPIRVYQPTGAGLPEARTARGLGGHEEEGIGREFPQCGREWHRRGQPEEVRAKDFPDKELGKVIPVGVYDLTCNQGWVSVGIDHNTAEFAKETHSPLVAEMGSPLYPRRQPNC